MNKRIEDLLLNIRELERELSLEIEQELAKIQEHLRYTIQKGKVQFQAGALAAQKAFKKDLYHYIRDSNVLFIICSPVIYALIVPLVLLDLFITLYQNICFPIYGIEKVSRSDYLIIDRQYLAYLNIIERLNCMYCGYGNGLLSYSLEIASRTEAFWCPIKHAKNIRDAHSRYPGIIQRRGCAPPASKRHRCPQQHRSRCAYYL